MDALWLPTVYAAQTFGTGLQNERAQLFLKHHPNPSTTHEKNDASPANTGGFDRRTSRRHLCPSRALLLDLRPQPRPPFVHRRQLVAQRPPPLRRFAPPSRPPHLPRF